MARFDWVGLPPSALRPRGRCRQPPAGCICARSGRCSCGALIPRRRRSDARDGGHGLRRDPGDRTGPRRHRCGRSEAGPRHRYSAPRCGARDRPDAGGCLPHGRRGTFRGRCRHARDARERQGPRGALRLLCESRAPADLGPGRRLVARRVRRDGTPEGSRRGRPRSRRLRPARPGPAQGCAAGAMGRNPT